MISDIYKTLGFLRANYLTELAIYIKSCGNLVRLRQTKIKEYNYLIQKFHIEFLEI